MFNLSSIEPMSIKEGNIRDAEVLKYEGENCILKDTQTKQLFKIPTSKIKLYGQVAAVVQPILIMLS